MLAAVMRCYCSVGKGSKEARKEAPSIIQATRAKPDHQIPFFSGVLVFVFCFSGTRD